MFLDCVRIHFIPSRRQRLCQLSVAFQLRDETKFTIVLKPSSTNITIFRQSLMDKKEGLLILLETAANCYYLRKCDWCYSQQMLYFPQSGTNIRSVCNNSYFFFLI